ncbi:heart development protein with EGF like domain 1 [Willisornis vidua]|uniref:Heart development protein with EGF like domain 1 n=1 Tax=Willisornis vidua TaxID=1566151 RepID=A0ABQ9CRF5_9PASS|nr:heart development protein with EGF like domain 1 [Willisornis vidua]
MLLLEKHCHLSNGTTTTGGTSSLHHLVLVNNVLLVTGTMMERGERLFSDVIESSHQEGRSSNTGLRTPGAPVDSVELVTVLAGSTEWVSLPARHRAVPVANRVMGHTGSPVSNGDVTPLGAGSLDNLSTGTATHLPIHSHPPDAGSHHHAAGRQERGKRALASPSTPAAAERTPPGLEAVSTDSAERTQTGHRGVWNMLGFNNTMRTVLLPSSSESHHPAVGSSYQPSNNSATERRVSDFPTTRTSISTTATKSGGRTLRSLPASTRLVNTTEISTSGTEIINSSAQTQTPVLSMGAQDGGGRGVTDPLLTGLPSASQSASTTFSSKYKPKSIPAADVTLRSDTRSADMPSMAGETLMSSANGHTAGLTRGSATSIDPTSSLGVTSSSSETVTHRPNSSQETTDLPVHPRDPLLTRSLSASESIFRGVRSSQQPVNSTMAEKPPFTSSATSTSISAMASSSGGRTPRSATVSKQWAAEVSTSSSGMYRTLGTIQSLSTSSVRGTYRVQGSIEVMDLTERVADSSLTHSHSPSEDPSPASGSSHVPFSILSTERPNFPATRTSISTAGTRSGGRMLRSLPASTMLAQTTEISTTGTENISSPGHSQSSLGTQGGADRNATMLSLNLLLTGSSSSLESTSPAEGTSAIGGYLPLTSTPSAEIITTGEERSTLPVVDTHGASSAAGSSAPTPSHTSTLDMVLLLSSSEEPGKQNDVSQSGAEHSELPTKLLPAISPSISVPTPSPSASGRGRRVSGIPTETTYTSTTLTSHRQGTSQAASSHGMWSTEAENPTPHLDTAGETHTGPLQSSMAWPGVRHVPSGRSEYPEPKVTLSSGVFTYFSAAGEPSTISSSHHSLSSSSAEERMSSPITDPVYSSSTSAGEEGRMLPTAMDGTLAGGMETSSSYAKVSSSSGLAEPALVEHSETANASTSSGGYTDLATETVFVRSSKIPTYSSFQNDLKNFSGSHQPVSSIDGEKRTSDSHTDGTYISVTYTRGGERTLLSISNNSTSADSSESSTFFSEVSSPSDALKSSVAQDRRTSASSDSSFVEPSTEPLLVHSSKPLTSASTGSTENTTLSNTETELLATNRSSLSSSSFPVSSSLSSLHHLQSSTPPPTHLFTPSESPEPRSSSVMASSSPLQALSSSLPTSSLLSSSYSLASLLPLVSSPSSISQSSNSDQASTTVAVTVVRRMPSTATMAGSPPRETKHGVTHQPQISTTFSLTGSPLPTAPMELLGGRTMSTSISMSTPVTVTETALLRAATTQEGSSEKATSLLTTASVVPRAGPTDVPLIPLPSATNHSNIVPAVALTTVKPPVLTTPASRQPTPGEATTMKDHRAQTPTPTKHVYTTGEITEAVDPTTAKPGKVTEENVPVTSPSEAPPTIKTTVRIATTLAATKPTTVPPLSSTVGLKTSSTATDVDKCLSNPCPALATCNNSHGSYICQCPLGYELEKGKCNLVRIFIGQVPLKHNITHGKYAELFHVENEILAMLNASLSALPGYHHSTVKASREANFVHVSVQSTFSLASNVTFYDVISSVKSYIRACKSPTEACRFISSLKTLHRACEDGYKLENQTCVSCPFGLGGFNCGNPYQLITVVIAAAGGGLLLIMGIALIVTCCRKNKNDISKLIFKSGDFQMSPYAEYPKNPRAQEWGRETIEMQENGSTKNLLQMTDVYYSVSIHSLTINP